MLTRTVVGSDGRLDSLFGSHLRQPIWKNIFDDIFENQILQTVGKSSFTTCVEKQFTEKLLGEHFNPRTSKAKSIGFFHLKLKAFKQSR